MGSYLSSSPKTYITNWTEAMAGGKRHYTDVEGLAPDDSVRELEQELDVAEHERRPRVRQRDGQRVQQDDEVQQLGFARLNWRLNRRFGG